MTKLDAATIAARWWAQQVGAADDDAVQLPGATGQLLAVMRRRLSRPTAAQVVLFESTLFSAIFRQIDSDPGAAWWLAVAMDWHPDQALGEALQVAGIDKFLLPTKTTMHISPGRILVQVGEAGEWQELTP